MEQVTNSDLRALMNSLPRIRENEPIRDQINTLMKKGRVIRDPFTYNATFLAIAPAAAPVANVNIQADSAFLIQSHTYVADIAAATQTDATRVIPSVTVLLTDSGSGRQFMDAAVAVGALFGTGLFPYVLPQPRLMAARSNLVVQATNFDAAATYNLRLYFNGVKLFSLND